MINVDLTYICEFICIIKFLKSKYLQVSELQNFIDIFGYSTKIVQHLVAIFQDKVLVAMEI